MPFADGPTPQEEVADSPEDEPQTGPARLFVGQPRAVAPAGVRAAGFAEKSQAGDANDEVVDEAWESRLRWTGLDRSARTVVEDQDARRGRERRERAQLATEEPQAARRGLVAPARPEPPEPPAPEAETVPAEEDFFTAIPAAAPPRRPSVARGIDPFARPPPAPFVPRTQRSGHEERPIPAAAWAAVGVALLIVAGGYVWYRVRPATPAVAELVTEADAVPAPPLRPPPEPLPVPVPVLDASPAPASKPPVVPPVAADSPAKVIGIPATPAGRLRLHTDEEARIRIDGKGHGSVGKLEDYELPIGNHTVTVTSIRTGRTLTQRVRIDEGRGTEVVFTFR